MVFTLVFIQMAFIYKFIFVNKLPQNFVTFKTSTMRSQKPPVNDGNRNSLTELLRASNRMHQTIQACNLLTIDWFCSQTTLILSDHYLSDSYKQGIVWCIFSLSMFYIICDDAYTIVIKYLMAASLKLLKVIEPNWVPFLLLSRSWLW